MIGPGTARREIPSGTVTFLFSDIEGSTQRWEQHRDAMADAVRRHDAIMRASIEAHDGYVFKTIGDAFCAAFANAHACIAAAYEAQRAFAGDEWLSVDGLRVRMSIHTGSTDERDGDYFGPAVNRVARLLAVAHGGQVITSGVSADLLQGQMPPQTSLRDLGAHRLKDLTFPEQVYQLVSPELRSDFPPLRSLDTLPHNLPLQATSFVGRDEAIADIKELLARARAVTLVGTGGVGKTRTSLQVAADLLDGYPDGVWFVEFAPLADPSLATTAISSAVGVAPAADLTPSAALLAHLKMRRLLLVLDNCEHVVEEVARIADGVIRTAPNVTILATSREALNVSGEHVYRMPSLAVPPPETRVTATEAMTYGAISLFVERANAADARFRLDDANANAVAEICRRLDGIALAIELAAPRIKVLSAQQLSQRLDERFRLLTGGSRAALPRQQTMRALIDWSYDLLSEDEKTIFRRVSIFAGGWTIDAASEVCADDTIETWDVLDILSTLVDKSLVASELHGSHQRYRLLESMRQYARERLTASADAAAVARRHAEFFSAMAKRSESEWTSLNEVGWLEVYAPEIDNFRLAFGWAVESGNDVSVGSPMAPALWRLFDRLATNDEGLRWCDTVITRSPDLPMIEKARIEYARALLLANISRMVSAAATSERSIALYRETDDVEGLTNALVSAIYVYARAQRESEASAIAAEALERVRASGDRGMLARALQYCGSASDDIDRARAMFAESASLFRQVGRESDRLNALLWWAEIESKFGNYPRAIELTLEAKQGLAGRAVFLAVAATNMTAYRLVVDESGITAEDFAEALEVVLAAKTPENLAALLLYGAALMRRDGRSLEAARLLGFSDAKFRAIEAQRGPTEQVPYDRLHAALTSELGADEVLKLMNEGAEWTEQQALAMARTV